MGYTGHQSIRRISGNQIQPIQRRSIQKPQHSTGRNGSVLKDGNILNLDDFGSFSLNGNFCEDKEPDENHRAESIQVKNVVFKADKNLKKRISAAGFEKYNPKKHNKRKY